MSSSDIFSPTFFEKVQRAEARGQVIIESCRRDMILNYLEATLIGMMYLSDGQTMALYIEKKTIKGTYDFSIEIPDLAVLRNYESLIEHIRKNTDLKIERITMAR